MSMDCAQGDREMAERWIMLNFKGIKEEERVRLGSRLTFLPSPLPQKQKAAAAAAKKQKLLNPHALWPKVLASAYQVLVIPLLSSPLLLPLVTQQQKTKALHQTTPLVMDSIVPEVPNWASAAL